MLPFVIVILYCIAINKLAICNNNIDAKESKVKYYQNLIKTRIQASDEYKLPENAEIYKPTSNVSLEEDYGYFDFIVIGAGATGAVIANRLSEVKEWNVLLLEAGSFGDNFTSIPGLEPYLFFSDYNWGYQSIPQKSSCLGLVDQICPYPRGRGVGGTTLINGLVYARGNPKDFDKWADMGNPGWSYQEVLPYFKKSEDFYKTDQIAVVDENSHGIGGYVKVEYPLPRNVHVDAFLQANIELGYKLTDPNGPDQIGVTPIQSAIGNGRRQDTGTTFIKPFLYRNNLKVLERSYVTNVIIDPITKIANGVQFTRNGKRYKACSEKEIILSAGAFGSPQILMLSGVGPKEHLDALNISLVMDLEVGTTLRDHSTVFGITFSTNKAAKMDSLKMDIRKYLRGYGPLTMAGSIQGVGFYQTTDKATPGYPDIELLLMTPNHYPPSRPFPQWTKENSEAMWGRNDYRKAITVLVILLHPRSVGTFRLKSKDPFEYPLINPRLLSDLANKDITTLYNGVQLTLNFTKTKAFKKINAKFQGKPLPHCKNHKFLSEAYWYCAIRQLTFNVYHPAGTCPMGPDTGRAVVDSELKVHGIKGLRVADASVFPSTLSGHPMAPCMMIGEKIADLIKETYI